MGRLPVRPNLAQLRRQAKELLRSAQRGHADAAERLAAVSDRVCLTSAQLAIAREQGFSSWSRLKAAVEAAGAGPPEPSGPHTADARIGGAAQFLAWARGQGWEPGDLPSGVVLTSESFLTRWAKAQPGRFSLSTTITPTNGTVFVTNQEPRVALACLGPGGPALVILVEHLAALGIERFIFAGPAPAIDPGVEPGTVVIADKAVRDDGVSQHYLPPGRYVRPSASLSQQLRAAAQHKGLAATFAATWTVSTPYHTNAPGLIDHRAEGVVTTELAVAALFAVAEARSVEAAAGLYVTRTLEPTTATPLDPGRSRDTVFELVDAAITVAAQGTGRS